MAAKSSKALQSPLRNKESFPPFSRLLGENEADETYYKTRDGFTYQRRRHWCFIGEIFNDEASQFPFFRNRVWVKDIEGNTNISAAFYPEPEQSRMFFDFTALRNGHTLCIRYAEQHFFLDLTVGFRVETLAFVKVIKCSLDTLLEISDLNPVERPRLCWSCNASESEVARKKLLSCQQCKCAKYCGKQCQKADWKKHKKHCKYIPEYCVLVSLEGEKYRQPVPFTIMPF